MSKAVASIRFKLKWWFKLWLEGLILAAWLSGRTPDPEKVAAMAKHGVKIEIN